MAIKVRLRRKWRISPVTRIKESKKKYSRKKGKKELQKELEENPIKSK